MEEFSSQERLYVSSDDTERDWQYVQELSDVVAASLQEYARLLICR